jgi:hypothetical protein
MTPNPEAIEQAVQAHVAIARADPCAFMSLVMRDESTGRPLLMSGMHQAWQDMVSQHPRLLIWSHIESGKTNQISIGRAIWELGRDPTTRIAVVSNTHMQASKIVRAISKYIETPSELQLVFPHLKPAEPWTSTQLFIERPVTSKDPSVQASGVHGNITGARVDLLILDDVLDFENCRTPSMRQDLWDWYHATLSGRLTQRAKVVVVGTAYHPDDFLHRLARQPGWASFVYPIIDPDSGASRWPERWSLSRIEAKKAELGPLEFARQMLCQARDDAEARFKKEWIDKALERGNGVQLQPTLLSVPPGSKVFTGVDLGVQRHAKAGKTVLFSILIHPNGDRQVLWIDAGRFNGPDIVNRIIDTHRRLLSIAIVENNAAQEFILQFARGQSAVPVKPFTTGRNKANPEFGVESMATEMANGKWIIPNDQGRVHPEVAEWITEMLYYDPAGHTGDRLMASWFAREGARTNPKKVQFGRLDLTSR